MGGHTPGPWAVKVFEPCSVGMSTMSNEARQSLAHAVVIGGREYTVAHTDQKVADIVWEPIDRDYVQSRTIKRYKLDRTPHPDALLCAAAPALLEVLQAMVDEQVEYMTINHLGDPEKQHNVKWARAVIAKAEGQTRVSETPHEGGGADT